MTNTVPDGPSVNQSAGPPPRAWTVLRFYDGANQLEYECYVRSDYPLTTDTRSISGSTLTSIVDSSNTATVTVPSAHGLVKGNKVTISGCTGDTDLNGTYVVQTTPTTLTFTITTASVTDDTYNNAGLQYTTDAPLTCNAIWAVKRWVYTGALITQIQWAAGTTAAIHICDNRASLEYR